MRCTLILLLCFGLLSVEPSSGAPRVVRVENGGLLFTDNPAGVSGTDAGFSVPIGRQVLWLFGDIFLLHPTRPEKPYVGAVSNAGLLVRKGSGAVPLQSYRFLTDPNTNMARQLIRNAPDEGNDVRLWPADGWFDERNQRLYLFYGAVRMFGSGTYDFRLVGHGLARADTKHPERMSFERLHAKGGPWFWKDDGAVYGAAVVSEGPGLGDWLYVAGVEKRGSVQYGKMSRVRRGRIADPAAYEYFAGISDGKPRWDRNPRAAADVSGLRDMPSEVSIRYNAYLGGYLAVHSVNLDDRIRISLASHPCGPYKPIGEIGAPRQAFTKSPCYAGKQHAEMSEQGGRVIYVTYVDQQRYWLQLLKVTLGK